MRLLEMYFDKIAEIEKRILGVHIQLDRDKFYTLSSGVISEHIFLQSKN